MTDWNKKLAAWLHDPAEKALILMRDPAGHEGGTVARLYEALGLSRADFDARADHLAAAADRPQWPRDASGGRWQAFERVDFGRRPELIHPLSGRRLDQIGSLQVGVEPIKALSLEHLRPLIRSDDARLTYLAFWRFGPEAGRLAPEIGELWSMLPADTRVPDHTIWAHLDVVAALHTALAGDADGPDQPALLAMSFGPVQGFIGQARSSSDLWAGSHLLASLVSEALGSIAADVGPDAVVFPALRGAPAFDRWLIEQGGAPFRALFERIGSPLLAQASDANPLFAASLPNKLVAIVPSRRARAIAEAATDKARRAALQWAHEAAQRVFDKAGVALTQVTRTQIDAQLRDFPEASWAAAAWPVASDANGLQAAARQVREALEAVHPALANQGVFAPEVWDVLRQAIPLQGATFWTPNTGILYPAVYELADRALSAAKAARPFAPLIQHGYRCTLTGEHEWLTENRDLLKLDRRERSARSVWGKLAADPRHRSLAKPGEHLGAIATLKRLWPTLFAERVAQLLELPPEQDVRRFVISTHALAVSTTIERLLQTPLDGQRADDLARIGADKTLDRVVLPARTARQLYRQPEALQAGLRRLPAALERLAEQPDDAELARQVRSALGGERPEAYYAVIQMDGDRMGAWISGSAGPHGQAAADPPAPAFGGDTGGLTFGQSWHSQIAQAARAHAAASPALARYLATRRPGSPARHLAISQALGQFSTLLARHVVEDCFKGRLLYCGGDDLLALVAVDDLPDAMQLLRLAYSGIAPDAAMGLQAHVRAWRGNGSARAADDAATARAPSLMLAGGFGWLADPAPAAAGQRGRRGRLLRLMGERATASMGAVIAHHTAPLSMVLRSVREAERQAKGAGRNAFCLRVLKRGGGEVALTSPWWPQTGDMPDTSRSALALLRELAGALAGTDFSRGALYRAQQWFVALTDRRTDADDPVWRAQMSGALQRQFERQQGSAQLARRIVDFVCEVMRPEAPRSAIEHFLMVGEFLARETRAFRLAADDAAQSDQRQEKPAA